MANSEAFFRATANVPISSKDILSFIFDDTTSYTDDKPIYIDAADSSHSLNRRDCRVMVRQLIAGLRATGLKTGDCVCVHSFNNLYYSCLYLAVVGAGLVWTGTNPGYSRYELVHHFKTADVKLIIAEPELFNDVLLAGQGCGISEENIFTFDWATRNSTATAPSRTWSSLLVRGECDWIRFDDISKGKSTTACLLFSSGTTGLPKAASLSHHNLVAQHILLHDQVPKPYQISRILCLPFFHAAMVPLGHITPLKGGQASYVMRRFQLEDFLKYTEQYQITEIFVVPPIIVTILQSPLIKKYSLRSLRWGMVGGAAMDLNSQKAFGALMNPAGSISPCYGMTELSCIAATYPWPEADKDGAVGYFLPNLDLRLLDEQDQDIQVYNRAGELLIRGPTVIAGYLKAPEANAQSFYQGWFRTGDIAYCDAGSKRWYIVDRKKELIKVRGFQVAPPELEAVLMSHPLVADAAVIGVRASNAVDGEAPMAYVVKRVGFSADALTEAELQKFVAGRVAKYKALSGGIVFLDSIPKTASGKYLKRELRERFTNETNGRPRL